jgi:hypothetical protein
LAILVDLRGVLAGAVALDEPLAATLTILRAVQVVRHVIRRLDLLEG